MLGPEAAAWIRLCDAPLVEGAVAAAAAAGVGASLDEVEAEARRAPPPRWSVSVRRHRRPPRSIHPTATGGRRSSSRSQPRWGSTPRPAARFVQTAAEFEAEILAENLTTGAGSRPGPQPDRRHHAGRVAGPPGSGPGPRCAIGCRARRARRARRPGLRRCADPVRGTRDRSPGRWYTTSQVPNAARSTGSQPRRAVRSGRPGVCGAARHGGANRARRRQNARRSGWHSIALAPICRCCVTPWRAKQARATPPCWTRSSPSWATRRCWSLPSPRSTRASAPRSPGTRRWRAPRVGSPRSTTAYLRARADDVREVGRRILDHLMGQGATTVLRGPGILIAPELGPAQLAALDMSMVQGIVVASGSPRHTRRFWRARSACRPLSVWVRWC